MGWGELPSATVNSREDIGHQRGSYVGKPVPRPSQVTDATVCAIARMLHGHFTPEQKGQVAAVLAAGQACGFTFTWTDVEYVEVAS